MVLLFCFSIRVLLAELFPFFDKCLTADSGYLVYATPHFIPINLKFCRFFCHDLSMCVWFWHLSSIFFLSLFPLWNFAFLGLKVHYRGYLVCTPPTIVLYRFETFWLGGWMGIRRHPMLTFWSTVFQSYILPLFFSGLLSY